MLMLSKLSWLTRLLLIFFILILLNLFFLFYLYFHFKLPAWIPFFKQHLVASDGTITMPQPITDPEIYQSAVGYTFEGTITQLIPMQQVPGLSTDLGPFTKIVIDIPPGNGLPDFITTSTTYIAKIDSQGGKTRTTINDLKIGKKVAIHMWYELSVLKRWVFREIYIYD